MRAGEHRRPVARHRSAAACGGDGGPLSASCAGSGTISPITGPGGTCTSRYPEGDGNRTASGFRTTTGSTVTAATCAVRSARDDRRRQQGAEAATAVRCVGPGARRGRPEDQQIAVPARAGADRENLDQPEVAGRHPGGVEGASAHLERRGVARAVVGTAGRAYSAGGRSYGGTSGNGPVADSGVGCAEAGTGLRLRPSSRPDEPSRDDT